MMLRKITLIRNPNNFGYPKALNEGLKIALEDSNYFLITNNDIEFYLETIDELLKASRSSHYGYITAVDKRRNWKYVENLQSDWWEGKCMSCFMTTKETIIKVGFFDEKLFPGNYEDIDWIHRASLLNIEGRSYIKALIEHEHGSTQKKYNFNSAEILNKNRDYVNKKHGIKLGW